MSRRSLAPVAWCLAGTLVLVLGWRALVVPHLDEKPDAREHIFDELYRPPTPMPYYSYRDPAEVDLLVVGTSRVDHGIVEGELEAAGLGVSTVFTGPGAQLLDLLHWTRMFEPGPLVVSLDPLGFHSETHPELLARFELEGAEGLFGEDWPFQRRADRYLNRITRDLQNRLFHPIDTATFHVSWFPKLNPNLSNRAFRERLRRSTRLTRRENAEALGPVLAEMVAEGWEIVCIRVPLSPSLLRIENNGFPPKHYREVCQTAGVPFLDYTQEEYVTYDGSHLAVWEARRFTRRLAEDLKGLGWGD